jgi:hypothetical protein
MDQGRWKARAAIWRPCTPAVRNLGDRITQHLRYACGKHLNSILSDHCHYLVSYQIECTCRWTGRTKVFILFNTFVWSVVNTVMSVCAP